MSLTTNTIPPPILEFSGEYRWLSNFYPVAGLVTVEHVFQASKTNNPIWRRSILRAPTPKEAKQLGRRCPLRSDWEIIKEQVMVDALVWKFPLYSSLAQSLCKTGGVWLEEGNDWNDRYWGTVNGIGQNRLGMLLMHRRAWLQQFMRNEES